MSTGKFCWFDLMSHDVERARVFYAELFGWDLRAHNAQYAMIHDRTGRMLGGMMAAQPGQPSAWLAYLTTDDIAATVAAVEAGGGRVFMQHTAPGVGTFAIFADPQGAAIAAIQLEKEGPYPREKAENHICWSDLMTPDREAALAFYVSVFGWEHQNWGGNYTLIGSEHAGAITDSPPGVPPHWLIYVNSPDTNATAARVAELGGTVLLPPREMGEVGRFAVFADPTGAAFAVMQTRR